MVIQITRVITKSKEEGIKLHFNKNKFVSVYQLVSQERYTEICSCAFLYVYLS